MEVDLQSRSSVDKNEDISVSLSLSLLNQFRLRLFMKMMMINPLHCTWAGALLCLNREETGRRGTSGEAKKRTKVKSHRSSFQESTFFFGE